MRGMRRSRLHRRLGKRSEAQGRIAYRCMKVRDSDDYFHFATAVDDGAPGDLGEAASSSTTPKRRTPPRRTLEVLPLEVVAETSFRG